MAALFFSLLFLLLPFARPRQRRRAGDNFNYGPRRVPRTPSTLGGRGGATPRHLPFGLCHLASLAALCIIHTLSEGATYHRRPAPSLPARLMDVTGQWWGGGGAGGEGVGRAVESKRKGKEP